MNIDPNTGLLDQAEQRPSPNYDARPDVHDISLIVIHNISLPPGEFGGPWIDALFTNTLDPDAHPYFTSISQMEVSSHLVIHRDGTIVQYVPFHQRAWHAGQSQYEGRQRCNDFSIGIELEGCDDKPFDDIQYEKLAQSIQCLIKSYPGLSTEHIAGHSDIAPGRKTDPGPCFDWQKLHNLLDTDTRET